MLFGLLGSKKNAYIPLWNTFQKTVDGKNYTVTVDTGHADLLVQKIYKNVLVVAIKLDQPSVDPKEQEKIADLAGDLQKNLQSLVPTFYIGSVQGEGSTLLYYALTQRVEDMIVMDMLERIKHVYTINWADDAGWSFIKNTLYPNAKETQHMVNEKMLQLVKIEQGKKDEVPLPRGLSHTIFFKDPQEKLKLVQELTAIGYYQIGVTHSVKAKDESTMPFFIEVGKDCLFDIENINKQTDELLDVLEKHNTRYDGWQAVRGNATVVVS